MSDLNVQPSKSVISRAVAKNKSKAADYLRDPQKSKKLLTEAIQKSKRREQNKGPLADLWNSLTALFRLFQAYIRREYTAIPWGSIVMVVVAILYFVSPIDMILDWLPLAGFIDDAAVIAFVIAQIKADLDRFIVWEEEKQDNTRTAKESS